MHSSQVHEAISEVRRPKAPMATPPDGILTLVATEMQENPTVSSARHQMIPLLHDIY